MLSRKLLGWQILEKLASFLEVQGIQSVLVWTLSSRLCLSLAVQAEDGRFANCW